MMFSVIKKFRHECADFSEGLETLGGVFNPHKKKCGPPTDEVITECRLSTQAQSFILLVMTQERRVGDLGIIVAGEDRVAKGEMVNDIVML